MKIGWFTPFSDRSAIGRFSRDVAVELAKSSELEVCCFDRGPIHEVEIPLRRFESAARVTQADLAKYDVVFYNFGNHFPFHGEIYLVSQQWPGIAILHDFVLHHFFAEYYMKHLKNSGAYVEAMARVYGREGEKKARESVSGAARVWETDSVVSFPLFEPVLEGSLGVIVHSDFLLDKVASAFAGPARKIPLAYSVDTNQEILTRAALGVSPQRALFVTIGHVNPNKRIMAVLDALRRIPSTRERIEYVIVGACDPAYRRQLEAAIEKIGLTGVVRLTGEVPGRVLRSYLAHADVCINLRFPAMEGASASAIEEMLYGKPLIVTNVGFYRELPDSGVIKIEPGAESQLAQVLERLLLNPAERESMGQASRDYAERQFRADSYAAASIKFAIEVRRARPLLDLADHIGVEFRRMGVTSAMPVVDSIAAELHSTFCKRPPDIS